MPSVSEQLQKALGHHQAGDVDRAEKIYREIIRIDSRHSDALHLLGVAAHQKKKHADAINLIGQAIEVNSASASYHCNLGAAYRALNQFEQAETCYRRAIHLAPDYADAHFNLGNTLNDQKRFPEAEDCFRRFLKLKPNHAPAIIQLGIVRQSMGDLPEAVTSFREAVKLNPQNVNAWSHLGAVLHMQDQDAESESCFRNVVQLQPGSAAGFHQLGLVLQKQKKLDEALKALDSAVSLQPDSAAIHCHRALLLNQLESPAPALQACLLSLELKLDNPKMLYQLGNMLVELALPDKAIECLQSSLVIDPKMVASWTNIGSLFKSKQQSEKAELAFRCALKLKPNSANAVNNLGAACQETGKFSEALELHQKALLLNPEGISILNNLAACFRSMGELENALDVSDQTVLLYSDNNEVYNVRASILESLGRTDEALQNYRKALNLLPNPNDLLAEKVRLTHQNIGLCWLLQGNFEEGWPEYEWRTHVPAAVQSMMIRDSWSQFSFENKNILVHTEQGIGDEVMFASCLAEMTSVAAECFVECESRLLPIFRRSFPGIQFLARPRGEEPTFAGVLKKIDLEVPIGSLPRFFRPNLESFPATRQYLIPATDLCEKWNRTIGDLGSGLKVGISFQGGGKPRMKKLRSIPLPLWKEVFAVPGVEFINLQYGDVQQELAEFEDRFGVVIHDFEDADPLVNLDEFIAQIAALDLVISIDNSTVHLAGALGQDVWTLLPNVPDWRWMLDRADTPWYPSMQLFRQQARGAWGDVLNTVADRLRSFQSENRAA